MGRVKLSSICSAALYLMIIIMMRGDLFFVSNENTHKNTLNLIVLIIAVGILLITLSRSDKSLKKLEYRFAKHYTIVVMAIGTFFWLFTTYLYGYTLYQGFTLSVRFMYIFISIPTIYIFEHEKGNKHFLNTVFVIVLVFLAVRFIAWLSYNYLPFNIFTNFAEEYSGWNRNGLRRLVGGQLFGLAFVLAVARDISKKNLDILKVGTTWKTFLIVVCIVAYCAFVTQSRYASMVMLVTYFVTYYFTRRKTTSKLSLFLLAVVSLALLIIGGILPKVISSFSVNSQYGEGTLSRLMGMRHFWNLFKTTGMNIGLGYVVNGYGTESFFVWEARPWLNFYIDDLGIIGSFFRYGSFVILIYGWLFVKMIVLAYRSIKTKGEYSALLISMASYFILSSLLSDQYDPSTAFSVPFYVAILSYVEPKLKSVHRCRMIKSTLYKDEHMKGGQ